MSDKNLRAELQREIEKAEGEAIFFPEYRRRRLILWAIRTTILAILYIIFWRYEWVRWTLVVSVPLSILFLVSLLVGPRLLRRKIERVQEAIDRIPDEVESGEMTWDDTGDDEDESDDRDEIEGEGEGKDGDEDERMNPTDPHSATTRFTDRVDAYTRYRPGYPDLLIDEIRSVISMSDWSVVADIGSGTGLSSELFLRHGMTVYGVEPNGAMRRAGEEYLKKYDRFHSVDGTAEATTLADGSVHLVATGQAFHWFDRAAVKREWQRILKPEGHVLLFWNSRRTGSTPFLREYEKMLHEYGTDYREINHQNISDDEVAEFFSPTTPHRIELYNEQLFDFEGIRGRLESSSYAPAPGHPDYEPMIERLRQIVEEYGEDGMVRVEYDLVAWLGRISERGHL